MMDTTKMLDYQFIQKAILNPLQNQKCIDMHAGTCNVKAINQFFMGCRSVYKMYLAVHIIPLLLFKRKKLIQNPKQQFFKLVKGFIKSLLFAGGYSFLIRRIVCWITQFYKYTEHCSTLSAIFAAGTLCFEPMGRQCQIALFCVNKSLQVSYNMLRRRGYNIKLPMGQAILTAFALGIIMFTYIECRQAYRQNYMRSILDHLFKNV